TATVAAVGLMSLALGFASCSDVAFWAAMIDVSGNEVGAAGGILNTGGNVGGSFAPVMTAVIAGRAGWSWGLYFGSFMAIAGMLTWMWVDPTRKIRQRREK
ncbi:MAG: MFS transporter, partial [Burkholderiales bacterium]